MIKASVFRRRLTNITLSTSPEFVLLVKIETIILSFLTPLLFGFMKPYRRCVSLDQATGSGVLGFIMGLCLSLFDCK